MRLKLQLFFGSLAYVCLIITAAFYQFHQYYIHGKFDLCKEYKNRVKNCIKWRTFQSVEAKVQLLDYK